MTAKVFMHVPGIHKTYETRWDHSKTVLEISYHKVFNGEKMDYFGQLIVTPEMVIINNQEWMEFLQTTYGNSRTS